MNDVIARYWRGDAPFWNRFWLLGVMGSLLYLVIAYCIIKYGISPPQNLALNIQEPAFYHANFTIFDAKTKLPYFIAGLIFLFYLFFAAVSILRPKKTPNQTIVHYIVKLIIVYAFIQSVIIVTEIGDYFLE